MLYRADINREKCVASGIDKNGIIRTVKLLVISHKCKPGFKCLRRKDPARNETCEVRLLTRQHVVVKFFYFVVVSILGRCRCLRVR